MSRKTIIITSILLALLPLLAAFRVSAEVTSQGLKISEIKLGGGNEPKEFVELFNDSNDDFKLDNIQIDYAKAGFDKSYCQSTSWKTHASPSSLVASKLLSGTLPAHDFAVVDISLTDNTSGSLRLSELKDNQLVQHDLVGWGASSPCFVGAPSSLPSSGQVIKRIFNEFGGLVEPKVDNSKDFTLSDNPSPGNDQCLIEDCYKSEPVDVLPAPYPVVKITELLPDPASPKLDAQDEYVELFNPNPENLNLDQYVLFTASQTNTYKFTLQNISLEPGEYLALYSMLTHLTLVNSTGRAWITAPDGTVLDETDWYPDTIKPNQSWSLMIDGWQVASTPTPGAPNLTSPVTELAALTIGVVACPEGKFRNPETGRCKNVVIASAAKPCKANQIRNPETNRCRNLATATTTKCNPGYERHTETNRCRKIITAVKSAHIEDNQKPNKINYLIIMISTILLAGYAIYEYRLDLRHLYVRIQQRLKKVNKEVVQ